MGAGLAPGQVRPRLTPLASEAWATIFVSFFLPTLQIQVGYVTVLQITL